MKYFGTVKSFDEATGRGFIVPETGGEDLRFDAKLGLLDPRRPAASRPAPVIRCASHQRPAQRREPRNDLGPKRRAQLSDCGAIGKQREETDEVPGRRASEAA